jgi:mRNA interferase MazF
MATPSAGAVVLIPFPFSDLTRSKLRPAVVLAEVGRGDWVMCQITSKPYADPLAVEIKAEDFNSGALKLTSYTRPGKLFTANETLIISGVGVLKIETLKKIVATAVQLLQSGLQP